MTRRTIAVTVYGQRVTCDVCGVALYVSRADMDKWLMKRGWVVNSGWDVCPGCREAAKVERVEG